MRSGLNCLESPGCLSPDPGLLHENKSRKEGAPNHLSPAWLHLGSAFGLFQWRIPCGGLSVLVVLSPLFCSPNAFSFSGQIFQRASHFMDGHEFWQHPGTAESSVLLPQGSCCQQRFFLFTVILQPTSILSSTVDYFYYMATWVLSFTTQSINRNWRNVLRKIVSLAG